MENRSVAFGLTGISLLVAIVALAFRGGSPASASVAAPPQSPSAPARDARTFSSVEDAVGRYDRGRRLLAEYAGGAWTTLAEGSRTLPLAGARIGLRVTIATIPDPFDSHMDWSYDANLEAMRRAFGTAGLVPQAFWLPSRGDSLAVTRDASTVRLSTHDVHPGVMLFRTTYPAAPALHLLYLVPEIPTAGVHLLAFRAALAERAAILREGSALFDVDAREVDELSVLGPNFSGSSPSLRSVVDGGVRPAGARASTDVRPATARIVSGSATSFTNLPILTDSSCVIVPRRGGDRAPGRVQVARLRFAATVNPDEAMDEVLARLVQSLDIEPYQVAILTESGTSYGAARPAADPRSEGDARRAPPRAPVCLRGERTSEEARLDEARVDADSAAARQAGTGYLTVPFPINIASLRVAIEQAPAAREPAQSLPSLGEAPRTRLSLDDAARPRESPNLTSTLSVPSLDVVLSSLVRTLQEHGVRLVVIKATDVRDKLMLAREVRRGLQDVMLVLYEGHVLLRRPEFADALRGTLVLSSYPMALENQFWSTSHRRAGSDSSFSRLTDLLALPTDASLGVYNATLALLGLPERRVEFTLHNAFAGDRTFFLPPVWLSVVGRDGFYPLRAQVPSARWWPYLGIRDALDSLPAASSERPHEHLYTHDALLSLLVFAPMLLLLGVVVVFLLGRKPFEALHFELPAFLERPTSARESLFFALFLLSLVASYLPFAIAVDARRTIGSLDPTLTGASRALWGVGLLSAVVVAVALVLLVNGWIGVLRRGTVPAKTPAKRPAKRPSRGEQAVALEGGAAPAIALGARLRAYLAPMRAATRVTGEGPAITETEPLDAYVRQTTRLERPLVARVGILIITVASLLFVACSLAYTGHLLALAARGGPEATLSMYRAMHLTSGVSPLLPLVLLALGFAIWTWWQLQQARSLDHHDPFESGIRRLAIRDGAEATWRRMYRAMVDARRGMSWIAPGVGVIGISLLMAVGAWFVGRRYLPSLEVIGHTGAADGWFDLALWIGLLSLLVSSSWAIYRLAYTWHGLERFLDVVAGLPLVNAFLRLPLDVVRITDVGFLGFRRDSRGDAAYADDLWATARQHASDTIALPVETLPRWERVQRALAALREGWERARARPNTGKEKDVPIEGDPAPADRARAWRTLEEYVACEVVLYVEGYLRNLRRLCFFLFASLLILVLVSAQYPYQPRSIVALASLLLLVATVVSVFWVMVRLSRNETISRISRTEPGRVTWDTSFVLNVVTFGVVPLLAFASSEFPAVRTFLFSWAEPLVRAVART